MKKCYMAMCYMAIGAASTLLIKRYYKDIMKLMDKEVECICNETNTAS